MTKPRLVYKSGEFVPESEATVSIFDTALMYGDMVFEMTRSYNQTPYRLRNHLERLYAGIKILEIDCGLTIDEMEAATMDTIEINKDRMPEGIDYQIMHNVSGGPMALYSSVFPEGIKPTVTINVWPLIWHIAPYGPKYESGIHCVVTAQQSVPARLIDPKIKNRSRIYYQMANILARKVDPDAYALLTDEDGYITEGTGNNFYIVKDGTIFTPEGRNILRGVTRRAVLDLSAELGIPCVEKNIEMYDVHTADEAFISSTSMFILPVTKFNDLPVGNGAVGPTVKRLISAFSGTVGVDIVGQSHEYATLAEAD